MCGHVTLSVTITQKHVTLDILSYRTQNVNRFLMSGPRSLCNNTSIATCLRERWSKRQTNKGGGQKLKGGYYMLVTVAGCGNESKG